jgi:hypothetical protein
MCHLWGLIVTRESIRLQSRCRTDQGHYNRVQLYFEGIDISSQHKEEGLKTWATYLNVQHLTKHIKLSNVSLEDLNQF